MIRESLGGLSLRPLSCKGMPPRRLSLRDSSAFESAFIMIESAIESANADFKLALRFAVSDPILFIARRESACLRLVCDRNIVRNR